MIEITEYCQSCKQELIKLMNEKRDETECNLIHTPITEFLIEMKGLRKQLVIYGLIFVLMGGASTGIFTKIFGNNNQTEQRAIVELINQINRKVDAMQVIKMEHKDVSKQNKELLKGPR